MSSELDLAFSSLVELSMKHVPLLTILTLLAVAVTFAACGSQPMLVHDPAAPQSSNPPPAPVQETPSLPVQTSPLEFVLLPASAEETPPAPAQKTPHAPAQETPPAPAQETMPEPEYRIHGAWEMRRDGVSWVISFIDDTFAIFRNGTVLQYGPYTLEPSAWGVAVTSDSPQNVYLEFGFERDFQGLAYVLSANELILSDTGWRPIGNSRYISDFPLGAYTRCSEPSETGNPIIGVWRRDYKDDEENDEVEIFRFFPNGGCAAIGFPLPYRPGFASILKCTYEWTAASGRGRLSLLRGAPDRENVAFRVMPFAVDGDILRLERVPAEFSKR